MAKQAGFRFFGLAFDKVLGYMFALVVAKTYGSTDLGLYFFAVGIFEAAFALTEFGFDRAEVRIVAALNAKGNRRETGAVLRTALLVTLPASIIGALVFHFYADQLAQSLNRPEVGSFLRLAAWTIPASTIANLLLSTLEGLGYLQYTVMSRMIVEPVVKVVSTVVVYYSFPDTRNANDLAIAYTISIFVAVPLSFFFYQRVFPVTIRGGELFAHAKDLLHTGIPVCALSLLGKLLSYADIFIIFTFVSAEATTHYAIAFRTALLTTMIATAFDAAFKPRIAAALSLGEADRVSKEFQTVARLVFTLCFPACLVFLVIPGKVMAVLGDQFTQASTVVAIAAAGTIVSYVAGPAGSALVMAGHSRVPFRHGLLASAVSVGISLALVPKIGIAGAAIGQFCSMLTSNTLNAVSARRRLGVLGVGRGHTSAVVAGLAAALACYGVSYAAPTNKYAGFVVSAGVLGLVYLGTLLVVGPHAEDWSIARALWRSVRERV